MVLIAMWLVYWADHLFPFDFYKMGILPRSVEGLKGIIFMPFLHSEEDVHHILNNSIPIFLFLASVIYFYREIALRIILIGWVLTGFAVWAYAENRGAYHIGMSAMIYLFAGFLFMSGVLRKYVPLQAISLFIIFFYGSMIWGIFPLEKKVSWEGHFMGLVVGVILAFWYRRKGPQRPRYQYEIERDMGIPPPDHEGAWNEHQRQAEIMRRLREGQENIHQTEYYHTIHLPSGQKIVYHVTPSNPEDKPKDKSES